MWIASKRCNNFLGTHTGITAAVDTSLPRVRDSKSEASDGERKVSLPGAGKFCAGSALSTERRSESGV